MKKSITKTKQKEDWKAAMSQSSTDIIKSLDSLIMFLKKNKKNINKDIKMFGARGAGVSELFETLAIALDLKISELWDIIDDN